MQVIKFCTAAAALAFCFMWSRVHADVITESESCRDHRNGPDWFSRTGASSCDGTWRRIRIRQRHPSALCRFSKNNPSAARHVTRCSRCLCMYVVLLAMVPAQRSAFEGAYKSIIGTIPEGEARERGVAFGEQVAKLFLEVRANDGMNVTGEYKPLTGAGQWKPTPPAVAPMALPNLVNVLPFTTKTFGFLKVEGPPALDSVTYARDLDEVREVGSRNSTTRTADQTASAIFWYISTPVPWEAAARAAVQKINPDLVDSARIFALVNMAGADAYIAGWQIKQKTNFWRPITAIREATPTRNPDPAWEPLLGTPPHPDYPSGHNIYSGAMAEVLRRLIGTDQLIFNSVLVLPVGTAAKKLEQPVRSREGRDGRANLGRYSFSDRRRGWHRAWPCHC